MPLRLLKRRRVYYIRGTVRGQHVYASTGTADPIQAEEARARLEARLWDRRAAGLKGTTTFGEALTLYLRGKRLGATDADALDDLLQWFGSARLSEIDQAAIDRYVAAKMPKAGPATILRHAIAPMSAVMHAAAKRGLCDPPTFIKPKQPKGIVRWITMDEGDRLIAASADHLKPIVTFLLYTGARLGEAIALDWRCVNLQAGTAVFEDTKNGETRGIPLHARAIAALANLPNREGRVFRRPDGQPYEGEGSPIRTAFMGACRRAGISGFRIHDCRHSFASWYVMAGGDVRSLAALLGHKTLQMVMRYSHLSPDHLRAGIDRIGRAKSVHAVPERSTKKSPATLTGQRGRPGRERRDYHRVAAAPVELECGATAAPGRPAPG
jgi:integrase